MAKSDNGGRRGGSRKKKETPAPIPEPVPDDLLPDEIESPPEEDSILSPPEPEGPRLVPVRSVVQRLLADLTPANAAATAKIARELEERFGELRRRAQQIEDGLTARNDIELSQDEPHLDALVEQPALEVAAAEQVMLENFTVLGLSDRGASTNAAGTDSEVRDGLKLDQFFANVSSSLIDAQRQLDQASMQYMLERDHTAIPPAVFSIPNVEAEVKVGFRSSTEKGIDILLIKNTKEAEQFGESTVRFNIVAAPPPPNARREFNQPIPQFLAVGIERDKVLQVVPDQPAGAKGIPSNFRAKSDWKSRAAVLRRIGDPVNSHSVIAPEAEDKKSGSRLLVVTIKPGAQAGSFEFADAFLEDDRTSDGNATTIDRWRLLSSGIANAIIRWLASVRTQ